MTKVYIRITTRMRNVHKLLHWTWKDLKHHHFLYKWNNWTWSLAIPWLSLVDFSMVHLHWILRSQVPTTITLKTTTIF